MKYVALLLLFVSSAMAADAPYTWAAGTMVPEATVKMAASIAAKITGYNVPDPLPAAYVLKDADMDAMLPETYGIVVYKDPTKIFLNEIIPSDTRFAVLVHEMVHVMQARVGLIPTNCMSNAANELEAYSASARFLAAAGLLIPIAIKIECH